MEKLHSIIPIVVVNGHAETASILRGLCEGGIPVAEITLRTPYAVEAIEFAAREFPDMTVGAGTVINAAQCSAAIRAGARFAVSPGLSAEVARVCAEAGIPYYPGCVTPTEIMAALDLGLTAVKYFPAGVYGGVSAIRSLSAPFPQVKFIPTGGIDNGNLREYLSLDCVAAVGGSWMFRGENIAANCRKIVEIVRGIKK